MSIRKKMANEDICSACGISAEKDGLPFNRNVENKGINLCGECGVDYQVKWRPEHSPIEPDVMGYVMYKRPRRF